MKETIGSFVTTDCELLSVLAHKKSSNKLVHLEARSGGPKLDTHISHDSTATILRNRIQRESIDDDDENAFYVGDLGEVHRQHRQWKALLPRVEPFYAVKCNPDKMVVKTLANLNTGFDCASKAEIQLALEMGIAPSRIIFANPCKQASHIRYAESAGVRMMTFDNADELHKIRRNHANAQLVLRILTDDSRSLCKLGTKFGASADAIPLLLSTARDLELSVIGISFHVGSGCYDASAFSEAVLLARRAFDEGERFGFKFHLLDIGGGFPGNHASGVTFPEIAALLRPAIDANFGPEVRVIAEPGRFYVSSAFTLAVNVIARRVTARDRKSTGDIDPYVPVATRDDHPSFMYYINDGMYGSFNCITFDHATVTPKVLVRSGAFLYKSHHQEAEFPCSVWGPTCDSIDCIGRGFDGMYGSFNCITFDHATVTPKVLVRSGAFLYKSHHQEAEFPCSVWGPTCDSIDCIGRGFSLPEMQIGDWLHFDNMGAYTMCAASQFNGFQKSSILYTNTEAGTPAH